MTPGQKKRAQQILRRFEQADPLPLQVNNAAVDMAAMLQELIDAPEPEQPNQSEQHLEMVNAPAPSVPDVDLVRDAERYRWLRDWTRGAYGIDSNPAFILPHVPTMLDQNIMSGSVAQHLDNAIDAAIERDKLKGGAP